GIRDLIVTGVQTCALPIYCGTTSGRGGHRAGRGGGEVRRRKARQGAPEGRLVAAATASAHARVRRRRYAAPSRPARRAGATAQGTGSAGLGQRGVQAARVAPLD